MAQGPVAGRAARTSQEATSAEAPNQIFVHRGRPRQDPPKFQGTASTPTASPPQREPPGGSRASDRPDVPSAEADTLPQNMHTEGTAHATSYVSPGLAPMGRAPSQR